MENLKKAELVGAPENNQVYLKPESIKQRLQRNPKTLKNKRSKKK